MVYRNSITLSNIKNTKIYFLVKLQKYKSSFSYSLCMESSNKSNKEYVILKFGDEGEEIKYLENGELFIADD